GKLSSTDITFPAPSRIVDRSSRFFIQEGKDWLSMVYPHVVGVIHEIFVDPSFLPVASINRHKGAIISDVIGFVCKGIFKNANGWGHTCPWATQILGRLTLHGTDHVGPIGCGGASDIGIVPGHHPYRKILRCAAVGIG